MVVVRHIYAGSSVFGIGMGRVQMRFVDGESLLEFGCGLLVLAFIRINGSESVQAFSQPRVRFAEHARSYSNGLLGQCQGLRETSGVAANDRQIVRALGIVRSVRANFGFTKFERLPQ